MSNPGWSADFELRLPVRLDHDFTSNDFPATLDSYPVWRTVFGGSFQAYLMQVTKALERNRARLGRTADDWLRRYLEHCGMGDFQRRCLEAENLGLKFGTPVGVFPEAGKWWWWDETQCDKYGPYDDEAAGQKELDRYCDTYLKPAPPMA